jgi:hypothetical protein
MEKRMLPPLLKAHGQKPPDSLLANHYPLNLRRTASLFSRKQSAALRHNAPSKIYTDHFLGGKEVSAFLIRIIIPVN